MELYIDTSNAEKIEQYCKEYPIAGFTCNPTIVTRDGQTVEELAKLVPGKRDSFKLSQKTMKVS